MLDCSPGASRAGGHSRMLANQLTGRNFDFHLVRAPTTFSLVRDENSGDGLNIDGPTSPNPTFLFSAR